MTTAARYDIDPLAAVVHESAQRVDDGFVRTSPQCWAYAVIARLHDVAPGDVADVDLVTAEFEVGEGRIGVGCLDRARTAFLCERFAGPGVQRVTLRVPRGAAGAVVFRNASPDGASRFRVLRVSVTHEVRSAASYPVHVSPRDVASEAIPAGGGIVVFDVGEAAAINRARMDFVRSLALPLSGRRVLDVGAGVGHFAALYHQLGARVVAVEGRSENVRELRRRLPDVEAHVGDIQTMDAAALGRFDVVHCFGLLYHLDSPVAALRRIESVCDGVLLLETMVCDAVAPILVLADETMAVNQALAGLGCRPSPAFLALALNRVGFPFVYGAATPPDHPDFHFEWRNSLETTRDGHNLRCVFVAARERLDTPSLIPLIEPDV